MSRYDKAHSKLTDTQQALMDNLAEVHAATGAPLDTLLQMSIGRGAATRQDAHRVAAAFTEAGLR